MNSMYVVSFLPANLKLGYPVTHCFIINISAEFHFYWIELNKAQSLAEYALSLSFLFPQPNPPDQLLTLTLHHLINHLQEAASFFKKRATIEDDYGKTLQKIARTTSDTYAMSDGKAG